MKGYFLKETIEENVAKHLIYGCSAKKITRIPLWDVCYPKNGHKKCQNLAKFSPKKRYI
jgi:hypothetical protein